MLKGASVSVTDALPDGLLSVALTPSFVVSALPSANVNSTVPAASAVWPANVSVRLSSAVRFSGAAGEPVSCSSGGTAITATMRVEEEEEEE